MAYAPTPLVPRPRRPGFVNGYSTGPVDTAAGARPAVQADAMNGYSSGFGQGILGGMPVGSRVALNQRADSAIGGALGQPPSPLPPVGHLYGNTGLAGAPMVRPSFGQTLADSQRSYLGARSQSASGTQQRIGEMFSQEQPKYTPNPFISDPRSGAQQMVGTYTGPSGAEMQVINRPPSAGRPYASTLIQGPQSAAQWGGMASSLPGADGRTNAEMAAARRAEVANQRQAASDNSLLGYAAQSGQSPSRYPRVRQAMIRQGIPVPGQRGGVAGATAAPQTIAQAQQQLSAISSSPVSQALGISDWNAMTPGQLEQILTGDQLAALAQPDQQQVQRGVQALLGPGRNFPISPYQRELAQAYIAGGPAGVRSIVERRAKENRENLMRSTGISPNAPTRGVGVWNLPPGGI